MTGKRKYMANFLETKTMLGRILGIRDVKEDEDIVIDLCNWRYNRHSRYLTGDDNNKQFVIGNNELKVLYDKVCLNSFDGLELYSNIQYEIAIELDLLTRNRDITLEHEDLSNGLVYKFGKPTIEYCIYLIMNLADTIKSQPKGYRNFPTRFLRAIDFNSFKDEDGNITLSTVLQEILGELTLKIYSSDGYGKSLAQFKNHKTSFLFELMYKSNIPTIEYADVADMFHLNSSMRERFDASLMDTPPLREYSVDSVDYYKLALSSRDPYIKYLSFYHIMEYFFDEVFKKKMVEDLRNKITLPDFSYKNDDKIYDIAKFIKNRWRMNDESGQGDELESLKFVLNEYVPVSDLQSRIKEIDSLSVSYYQSNKVLFCDAPVIGWNDTQGAITQIAKRVYFTRNALVHSKSGKNKERYRPYKDEKQLEKEIPLVKAIAELIIINSSRII